MKLLHTFDLTIGNTRYTVSAHLSTSGGRIISIDFIVVKDAYYNEIVWTGDGTFVRLYAAEEDAIFSKERILEFKKAMEQCRSMLQTHL